jgi:O-antigen/teichoic acid export membrane protein
LPDSKPNLPQTGYLSELFRIFAKIKSHEVDPLKRLAGQTAIYGLSSIVGRLINFLLVPLYTNLLFNTGEYGIIAEMYAYVAFLLIILTYGMETAFFRFSHQDPSQKQRVYSTTLMSVISTSFLFVLLVILLRQPLADTLRYPAHTEYIVWLGIIIGLDAINAIPFARLRAENKAFAFAAIKLIGIAANIIFILVFLVFSPWFLENHPDSFLYPAINRFYDPAIGVGYVFISNLIATSITSLFLLPVMLKAGFGISVDIWKNMLRYAWPLILVGLAGVINETLDKLLLKFMLPEDIAMSHVGIYSACYKISVFMTIFIQAFRFAAEPFFFSQAAHEQAREMYARVMKYFVVACLFIFLGIMLFMDIVQYFVGRDFRVGLAVVPILLMANLFLGIYFNLSIWYKLTGQTIYGAWIAIAGAAITILLNIWWIPLFGYHGSAWATLICYFSMMVISYFYGQKHYPVPYEPGKIILMIASALLIYLVSNLLPQLPTLAGYVVNFAMIGLFAITVWRIDPTLMKRKV